MNFAGRGGSFFTAALTPFVLLAVGCASSRTEAIRSAENRHPAAMPATQPGNAIARLYLAQIEPRPMLPEPASAPSSQPARAPLEAIELFARARDELLQNQRYRAINDIEKAIELDPGSFELHFALGRAYQGLPASSDRSIAAYERAARIEPNNIDVQVELGRAYQARGDTARAIEHFRLAMQTDGYKDADLLAGVVDYRLAVALEQQGYDRAALECYSSLLNRIEHASMGGRAAPEVGYLLSRPELLSDEIGRLYEKQGEFAEALRAYQRVAEIAPNDFDVQARVVRTLAKLGRKAETIAAAAQVVQRFHANPQSISLLKEVHEQSGARGSFTDVLRELHRQNPEDRSILFALADTLASSGQLDQSVRLLEQAIQTRNADPEIVERLYALYADRDQVIDAARLIIRVTAARPDTSSELEPHFLDLMRLSRKNSLRLPAMQKLQVPSDQEGACQYWTWRVATGWTRPTAARTALDQAARATPPFDPACRAQLIAIFNRTELDNSAKQRTAESLIESVRQKGRPDLAEELRGLLAVRLGAADQAVKAFAEAIRLSAPGQPSPDLQVEYALVLLSQGNGPRFEQLMWRLITDRPRFDAAYQYLYRYFKENNADSQAWNVVNTWVTADPTSPLARLQEASEFVAQRRGDEAIQLVRKLFEERPDDVSVVTSLKVLFQAAGQVQQAIDLLEAERTAHPANRIAVEALVDIYASRKRLADATRIVDAARAAVATDPDLLYYVAHLYQLIDQPETTEQVLEQVLKLDPTHAQAGNDLGYTWADAGKNLDRAESLIRLAVDAEPDNPSYLDSLGWVLYKRGQFDQALKLLEQASQPWEGADPIVLDHLGDALYRLNRQADARGAWQHSLQRVSQEQQRGDLANLPLQLQGKLRAADSGQPVNVAPVVETSPGKEQAKN